MKTFEKSRRLSCAGIDTFVAETGSGPPLVLIHGNPDTHDVWSYVVERLKSDFTCYAPDVPGFGESAIQDPCDLDRMADWVAALLTELKVDKPHLVIHDVGGTYGFAFAAKYPERVGKLTAFNGTFFPDYEWHFWGKVWRLPILGEIAMAFGNRALFIKETNKGSPKIPREYLERAYDAYGSKARKQVLRFYRYLSPSKFAGWDQRLLESLKQFPAQVIWGDKDPYIPKSTAERFGVKLHRFPELGHWAMLDEPENVAPLIRGL